MTAILPPTNVARRQPQQTRPSETRRVRPDPSPAPSTGTPAPIGCTYEYPDEQGRVLLRKHRYYKAPAPTREFPFPAPEKRFQMEARSRIDYAWVKPKGLRVKYPAAAAYFDGLLYRLPELIALQKDPAAHVYVTEGEKDADGVMGLNLPRVVAVSHWQGGAGPSPEQAQRLKGWLGRVTVCVDADPAGAAVGLQWFGLLKRIGMSRGQIRLVRAAGPTAPGRDVTDHLADGYGLEALVELDPQRLAKYAERHCSSDGLHPHHGSGRPTGYDVSLEGWHPTVLRPNGTRAP